MPTYDHGVAGLTGTIGVTVLNADGTAHDARATAGITEPVAGSGIYHFAHPHPGTLLLFIFDGGVGTVGGSCWDDGLTTMPARAGDAMTLTAAYDAAKDDVLTPLAVVAATIGEPEGATIADDINILTGVVTEGIPHFYYPNISSAIITGSIGAGTYASLASRDDTLLQLNEVAGGLEYITEFSGILAGHVLSEVSITGRYSGASPGHLIGVSVWNYATSSWIQKFTMLDRSSNFDYAAGLTADNVSGGLARIRFQHSAVSGNASHRLYLDRVQLTAVEETNQSAAEIAAILSMTYDIDNEVDELHTAALGTGINVLTNNDKSGYSGVATNMVAEAPTAEEIANEVELQILDDTDTEKVLQAIIDKINETISIDDNLATIIADAVRVELGQELNLLGNLTATGHIIVGQGTGSTQFTNSVDFGVSRQKQGYIIKAYALVNNTVNFSNIDAMDTTDINGRFDLWLDPGFYILRVEKNGAAVDTVEIEVV
jgi:hypothetical protein